MYQPEGEGRARARRIISGAGYKCGGHFAKGGGIRPDSVQDRLDITSAIHQHEGALHPGEDKTAIRLRRAYGGVAGGGMPMGRADRPARGKKPGGGKTHVNILIAPQGDKAGTEGPPPGGPMGGPPPGPPMGGPLPGGPPMGPPKPPPPPMAPPTGAPPMGVGAPMGGAPPMMRKAGGRTGRRRLQDGGMPGDDNEGMQMGGTPLPPAQGGGLRRAQGLGPPGWPGNPPAFNPNAMGAGATGGGPSSMSMMPSAGAGPGMGATRSPPPGFTMPGGGGPAGYNPNANIMAMAQPDRMAAMGYGSGAPSAAQMQAMANMGGQTPIGGTVSGPQAQINPAAAAAQQQASGASPGAPQQAAQAAQAAAQRKRGGRAPARYSPPDMEAGAGSGAGRLDKIGEDEPHYRR